MSNVMVFEEWSLKNVLVELALCENSPLRNWLSRLNA